MCKITNFCFSFRVSKYYNLKNLFLLKKIREALNNFEGCKVIDERVDGGYSTPLEAEGKDETFISRIREDKTIKMD